MRSGLRIVVVLAGATGIAAHADARPLDRKDCDTLSAELAALTANDIPKAIMNGPEWTLAHMPETVDEVRRYLAVEEQLRFRCSGKKPPDLDPAVADSDGGRPEETKPGARASLASDDGGVPAENNRHGGDTSSEPSARPAPAVRRKVRRAPASAAARPADTSGLDAAYRQLFPMGR